MSMTDGRTQKCNDNGCHKESGHAVRRKSVVDPEFEFIDPTPDIYTMFMQFNKRFFRGKLKAVEVKWSTRMTSDVGVCTYEGEGGLCTIKLSEPLLKLRPRKDLVETLLHEMIHAYLFTTNQDRDRHDHGPEFHKYMRRINREAGTNIGVYHEFNDEVEFCREHWWRCDGPCQNWRPNFGTVKRNKNRAPGPRDPWWRRHQSLCGGRFVKVLAAGRFLADGKNESNGTSKLCSNNTNSNSTKNINLNVNSTETRVNKDKNIRSSGCTSCGGTHMEDNCNKTKSSSSAEDNAEIECPMCDRTVQKRALRSHLEMCIQCVPREEEADCASERRASSSAPGVGPVPCPVCRRQVEESLMNEHLDQCLATDALE